jgi:hypothetical protein
MVDQTKARWRWRRLSGRVTAPLASSDDSSILGCISQLSIYVSSILREICLRSFPLDCTVPSGVTVWHPLTFPAARVLSHRRIARLRRKGPEWRAIALFVVVADLLLAGVAWIIVDVAQT